MTLPRHLKRVCTAQGMLQLDAGTCTSQEQLYSAWLHESIRVWGDGCIDKRDLATWRKLLARVLTTHWPATLAPADILSPHTYAKLPGVSNADAPPAGYCEVGILVMLICRLPRCLEQLGK